MYRVQYHAVLLQTCFKPAMTVHITYPRLYLLVIHYFYLNDQYAYVCSAAKPSLQWLRRMHSAFCKWLVNQAGFRIIYICAHSVFPASCFFLFITTRTPKTFPFLTDYNMYVYSTRWKKSVLCTLEYWHMI